MLTTKKVTPKPISAEKPHIILPSVIRILRDRLVQGVRTEASEFHLYFSNFIVPYHVEWDVQVTCDYGANYGDCWKITNQFPRDKDEFSLTIAVYDEDKTKLAEKTVTIKLCDRWVKQDPYRVLFFGDSMTHSAVYVTHAATKLYNLQTLGTRSFNGLIYLEGRGGWDMESYCTHRQAVPARVCSPFMFPCAVKGEDYYGDLLYWNEVKNPDHHPYAYDGYQYEELKDGQYFLSEGKLYQQTGDTATLVDEDPAFEFSFPKYIARHQFGRVDAVSVLIGANDLQHTPYDKLATELPRYIQYLRDFAASVKANDPNTAIVFNLPVLGADQHAWGTCVKCRTTQKTYNYNMQQAAMAILDEFGDREDEGFYVCPMQAVMDPVTSHPHATFYPTMYTSMSVTAQQDWVHPNLAGYYQMGDAIAAVLEDIRQSK